ncbi:MAG: HAMP domain-containing sensor histidine kinase [Bacteroides sp.]|nr:HAMP domain-containing sensor histidine kinase [Bacteroides sp.]MDD4055288.1 HAMP domain-containing sensor histidine kinase [Bacteroides sp.]MDD4721033.1 HAMP domain-containing sensor histidine kinase [Bacteroides sp.]NLI63224.1 HAMP domain-containing histidine kinase [Bacteroidales bacterium]
MRLVYKILIRISLAVIVLFAIWGAIFYYSIMEEVDDELNDALEVYSDQIIKKTLAGRELPPRIDGSNNSYYIEEVSTSYAKHVDAVSYKDSMIYIPERREKEPARVLRTIFKNKDNKYYELTVYTPAIEKKDIVEAIFSLLVILYGLLLLTLIVINVWVFQSSMRPLYVLLDWVKSYQLGGKNKPLDNDTNVREFQNLNDTLIRHINRSENTYNEQKLFIGNASHEMQTPLAICINRLEWLIDRPDLGEEQLGELLKVKQTLNYLVRLNKSLLFLSKIENRQFPECETININRLIEDHLIDYKEIYSYKNIIVNVIESEPVYLSLNETLAISLFTNLLKNAFIHTSEGGFITIVINLGRIIFSNTDSSGPLDKEKIFKRFHQTKKKEGSTGLGLVISQSICETYNIIIDYKYTDHSHHFVLTW